jgi:ADP-ribosylglycohydrolase
MLGAIAGDVIGSVFESQPLKSVAFPLFQSSSRFTDDTVLTVATAWAILREQPFETAYRTFGRRYPRAGYGAGFRAWLISDGGAYRSFGNGSAMRVSPVGWAFDEEESVLRVAEQSAIVTHDHPEGIKGAQAVAAAIWKARRGASKDEIREYVTGRFEYDLARTVEAIRPGYGFNVTCQGSVPEAIVAFLDAIDVEGAIRLAISLGGDSDTQAAIAGGIAHAFHGDVPGHLREEVHRRLPQEFLDIIDEFSTTYR